MFSSNSYEFSPIHEILDWKIYNVSKEFLTWIENERYPIVTWNHGTTQGTLSQMDDYRHGIWWIPVTLCYPFPLNIKKVFLNKKKPFATVHIDIPHSWWIINFKPAGKYMCNEIQYI